MTKAKNVARRLPTVATARKRMDSLLEVLDQALQAAAVPNACILATRLLTGIVADRWGWPCVPVPCDVQIFNPQARYLWEDIVARTGAAPDTNDPTVAEAFQRIGGYILATQGRALDGSIDANGWNGHLVAVIGAGVLGATPTLVDLSLRQGSRPAHNIRLGPLVTPATRAFVTGQRIVAAEVNGCTVRYLPTPENTSYRTVHDWTTPGLDSAHLGDLALAVAGRS